MTDTKEAPGVTGEEEEGLGGKPDLGFFFTDQLLERPPPTPGEVNAAAQILGEQFVLFDQIRRGTPEQRKHARRKLTELNTGLTGRVVNSNGWRTKVVEMELDRALELDDLFQEGVIGLMRATETYDYTTGFHFSTYANWWIKQSVSRAFESRGPIRLPMHIRELLNRFFGTVKRFTNELHRAPNLVEIQERLEVGDRTFQSLLFALFYYGQNKHVRLDNAAGGGKDGDSKTPLHELLTVDETDETGLGEEFVLPQPVMRRLRNRQLTVHVQDALESAGLSQDEKHIIIRRYGLDGDDEESLEEVGARMSVTHERIRQIQVRAIGKLRDPKLWERMINTKKRPPLEPYAPIKEAKTDDSVEDDAKESGWGGMPGMANTFIDFATAVLESPQLMQSERDILTRRDGLDGQPAETAKQIADRMGVTPARVEQLETKAREKVRNSNSSADGTKRTHQPSSPGIVTSKPTQSSSKRQTPVVPSTLSSLALPLGESVDVQDLMSVVVAFYSVSENDIMTKPHEQELVRPRHVLTYLLREHTSSSYGSIASLFGWTDTAQASTAYKQIRDSLPHFAELREELEQLYKMLTARLERQGAV